MKQIIKKKGILNDNRWYEQYFSEDFVIFTKVLIYIQ